MNKDSKWRFLTANKIADALVSNKIDAIILGGSTSRGHADKYSDIEIGIFWKCMPTLEERKNVITQININNNIFTLEDIFHEPFIDFVYYNGNRFTGLKIDLIHSTLNLIENDINEVVRNYSLNVHSHESVAAIVDAISLYNPILLNNLKNKIIEYPKELKLTIVRANLKFNPHFGKGLLLYRESMVVEFHQIINSYIRRILNVFLAVNEIYHGEDFKWIDKLVLKMKIKPSNFVLRINKVLKNDNTFEIWTEIETLIKDTIKIVEKELPEIDTEPAKNWFLIERKEWKQEPILDLK